MSTFVHHPPGDGSSVPEPLEVFAEPLGIPTTSEPDPQAAGAANAAGDQSRSPYADPRMVERFYALGAPRDPRAGVLLPVPLWRQVAGFKRPQAESLTQRRAGLRRLVEWVTLWLQLVLRDRGERAADPRWEPSRELAQVLEIPEGRLNSLCREHHGQSAREIWDRLRFEAFVAALRAEIERMLDGRRFAPAPAEPADQTEPAVTSESAAASGSRVRAASRASARARTRPDRFAQAQYALRVARREAGWTRLDFAWRFGYSYFARMNLAAFRARGATMQALEAEILREIAAAWHFDDATCTLLREAPAAAAPETAPSRAGANAAVDANVSVERADAASHEDASSTPARAVVADAGPAPVAGTLGLDRAAPVLKLVPRPSAQLSPHARDAASSGTQSSARTRVAETPPAKVYPHVEPWGRFVVYRPDVQAGPPPRFTEGRPDLVPYLPKLRGRRQHEARSASGRLVRVFADTVEVWKYFLRHGYYGDQVEAFARKDKVSLDAFLERYVRHGMVIVYPLHANVPVP